MKAYHGTSSSFGLKKGDILEADGGSWAALHFEDAVPYALSATTAEKIRAELEDLEIEVVPVVYEVEVSENCKKLHDGSCWAYTDRWGGYIEIIKKSRRKIKTEESYFREY